MGKEKKKPHTMSIEDEFDIYHIDMNRLEEQAAEHAFLYVQLSKKLKKLKKLAAKTKTNLELVEAELKLKIVANPKKYKLPAKPTAPMVNSKILTMKKYKDAYYDDVIQQDLVATYQIYVNAFDHRKRMISECVQLHHDQYFTKPYVASSETKVVIKQLEKQQIRRSMGKKKSK